jgi:predicted MPP superfamily phosphohydrolase
MLDLIAAAGMKMLVNEAVALRRDSVAIALVGTENWGVKKRHPKRADLDKALTGVSNIPFKILLAHDPAYWQHFIADRSDIALTLSGHTHGMQMGFRAGGKYYGPGDVLYRYWAGLYHKNGAYLYVNVGVGVGAFLGRVGMTPEITVIELRRAGWHAN